MKNNISFEEAITKLERVTDKLEGGTLTLDESIKAYEEAMGLVGVCNSILEGAEIRVRALSEGKDGSVSDVPFAVDKDEN